MKRLKILVCTFACDPKAHSGLGSGEDMLGWNIISQIGKFADVFVLASVKNKINVEQFLGDNKREHIHFYYIDLPGWISIPLFWAWSHGGSQMYSYLWQIKIYFVAKKMYKKIHFDIFHHVTYANDWLVSFVGALLPTPYIRGPGGGAHKTPKAFLTEYSFRQKLWQYFRSFNQWIFRQDPFFIMGRSRAKAILVCNKEALCVIPERFLKKTFLFPVTGVSENDFKIISNAQALLQSHEIFTVLSAGTLLPIKGFNLTIRAFKIFVDRNPNARMVIVGDGVEFSNLKKLISFLNIEDKVLLKGRQERHDLLKEMVASDVFLFSSLRDGGGAVVVEAMAAGLPVICLGIAGPGFHINDNYGIKIEPNNPDQAVRDMAVALERLYSNKDLRMKLGKAAQQKAMTDYSWDRLGERLEKIYKDSL